MIVGATLSGAGGVLGAIGVFLAVLGLCVAFAFLMARHSAQVQAARERPLLGRERLTAWLSRSVAMIAGVICLVLLVGALVSSGPRAMHIGAGMRQAAAGVVPAFTQRIEVSEKKEAHRRETEELKAIEEEEQAQACDPSYVGECLKDGIGDYDCASGSGDGPNYVYSEVTVVGPDVFGLDANGNGIGCEGE